MSTNATVAKVNADGSVDEIYVHWDGYVEGGVGETLFKHYTDEAKVQELLELGDLSIIGPEIGTKHDFLIRDDNVCTAYSRDRGESNTQKTRYNDFDFYKLKGGGHEYEYFYREDVWFVYSKGSYVELAVLFKMQSTDA